MNDFPKTPLSLRVEDYVFRFIKIHSMHEGLTMAEFLTCLVDEELERNPDLAKQYEAYIYQNRRVK
ncbi:hypothetical protein A7K91_00110 [Paenibacillus oryzae]|jgi:hypothetical protein|uniref:Uncharacterized protein n=1 Tax=Paenibacillus oryzae TaxID=1844972 RepID=A0A1A5YM81_9BACL|nr:hypothetical protein [Paenibacillus oryzae]OBR66722.1 hypothetical protein A7K91_00110 [Paenibacillus oryzae]